MDLDIYSTGNLGLKHPALQAGLREVLRGWSGAGQLFEALAAVSSPDALDWSPEDIRRRASRVVLSLVEPSFSSWPRTSREWIAYIPPASRAENQFRRIPAGSVNWLRTRRSSTRWPPTSYHSRIRSRVPDSIAVSTLAWMAQTLRAVAVDATLHWPEGATALNRRVDAISEALNMIGEPLELRRPDRPTLLTLRASGYPWSSVASVAELLIRVERDPEFVAYELILPDPELGWRIFHLATFGLVIRALRNHRFVLAWRRPLSGSRTGSQIEAISPSGVHYDLWFEAAAARSAYRLPPSAYHRAVAGIPGAGGPMGADVLLIAPTVRALLLECKWSDSPTYVARDGFHQAASYALDALNGMTPMAWSFVVGPIDVVRQPSATTVLDRATIGSIPFTGIPDLVNAFLAEDPAAL